MVDALSKRLLATLLGLLLTNCASGIRPLGPSAAIDLEPDEGLLILHVDSDRPIAEIDVNGSSIASGLPAGNHAWMVRASAGSYRFSALQLAVGMGRSRARSIDADDEFRFEVVAGHVNYGAALVIRSGRDDIEVRGRNHVAMAIRMLSDRDAAIAAKHPLRYGGRGNGDFLDYYSQERRAGSEVEP
jgi:hypothetical protein